MSTATPRPYVSLSIAGCLDDACVAFELAGREEISTPHEFTVRAVALRGEVLGADVIGRKAHLTFGLTNSPESRTIPLIVAHFSLGGPSPQGEIVYTFHLAAALSQLGMNRQSEIFGTVEPMSAPDVIKAEFDPTRAARLLVDQEALAGLDCVMRLRWTYPTREHIAQFEETDLAFVSRLAEFHGISYILEAEGDRERVAFCDDNTFFPDLEGGGSVAFTGPGPAGIITAGVMQDLSCARHPAPRRVYVQDENDEHPRVSLLAQVQVDQDGQGTWVEYGSHHVTPGEGERLAQSRAEALRCRQTVFSGTTTVARLAAGRVIALRHHPITAWNQAYLIVSVQHALKVWAGDLPSVASPSWAADYSNSFTAIPFRIDLPFRPPMRTPRPKVAGLLRGRIETSFGNLLPSLDAAGRYRVRLGIDLSRTPAGFGSCWMRKAESYGGASNGMHFPLPPGTPVLVACINGDPDRPVIVGVAPDADNPSQVTSSDHRINRIRTRSGITITLFDPDPARDRAQG